MPIKIANLPDLATINDEDLLIIQEFQSLSKITSKVTFAALKARILASTPAVVNKNLKVSLSTAQVQGLNTPLQILAPVASKILLINSAIIVTSSGTPYGTNAPHVGISLGNAVTSIYDAAFIASDCLNNASKYFVCVNPNQNVFASNTLGAGLFMTSFSYAGSVFPPNTGNLSLTVYLNYSEITI